MTIKISVCIPTHNRAKYVGRALRSLIDQSFDRSFYEIIVVDDGSVDSTKIALRAFEKDIILINNKEQEGLSRCLNKAILKSRGKYFLRVDSDDYVNHDYLKFLFLMIDLNKDVDAVSCDYLLVDDKENIITGVNDTEETLERKFKKKIYSIGWALRDNFITFRFLYLVSEKTEEIKNYIKFKSKSAKLLNKSFFKITREEAIYYRMTHIDRGYWTFNDEKFKEIQKGLEQAEKYLIKLFNLLKLNNIESYLIIYPWPTQIEYGDQRHAPHWENFSKENNINLINLYNIFQTENKKKLIFENFIYGDIHWNKQGTSKVLNEIVNRINF